MSIRKDSRGYIYFLIYNSFNWIGTTIQLGQNIFNYDSGLILHFVFLKNSTEYGENYTMGMTYKKISTINYFME